MADVALGGLPRLPLTYKKGSHLKGLQLSGSITFHFARLLRNESTMPQERRLGQVRLLSVRLIVSLISGSHSGFPVLHVLRSPKGEAGPAKRPGAEGGGSWGEPRGKCRALSRRKVAQTASENRRTIQQPGTPGRSGHPEYQAGTHCRSLRDSPNNSKSSPWRFRKQSQTTRSKAISFAGTADRRISMRFPCIGMMKLWANWSSFTMPAISMRRLPTYGVKLSCGC